MTQKVLHPCGQLSQVTQLTAGVCDGVCLTSFVPEVGPLISQCAASSYAMPDQEAVAESFVLSSCTPSASLAWYDYEPCSGAVPSAAPSMPQTQFSPERATSARRRTRGDRDAPPGDDDVATPTSARYETAAAAGSHRWVLQSRWLLPESPLQSQWTSAWMMSSRRRRRPR